MNSIKVCEYSRSRSFHDDLILQDQASGERSQDQWSSGVGFLMQWLKLQNLTHFVRNGLNHHYTTKTKLYSYRKQSEIVLKFQI